MKALRYSEPRKHSVVEVPLPVVRDGDVLIKGFPLYHYLGLIVSRRMWSLRNRSSYP